MKRSFGKKIERWVASRPWLGFCYGLPALVAGLLVLGVAGLYHTNLLDRGEMARRCGQIARQALASRQFELAQVAALRGQLYARSSNELLEWKYYQAVALGGLGHAAAARKLMRAAAPLDHPGYAPAHLALAESLITATNLTPELLPQVELHLNYALRLDPQSVAAHEMLGRYYINTRHPDKARLHLEQIFPQKPEVALLLAVNENADHNPTRAVFWARQATAAFEKKLQAALPHDRPADRLGLVESLLFQNLFMGAARALEAGLGCAKSPAYYAALTEVCDKWVAHLSANAPGEAEAMELWLAIVFLSHGPDPFGPKAQAYLQKQLHGPPAIAAQWHLLLATDARWQNRLADVRPHLQAAYRLAPENPIVANDYAYNLAVDQPADLAQALAIIQPVVEKFPRSANYRDTRSRILLLLNRPADAVPDLEFAAAQPNCGAGTLEALAKAYPAVKSAFPTPEQLALWPGIVDLATSHGAAAGAAQALVKQQSENAPPGVAAWWHYFLAAAERKAGQGASARTHLQTANRLAPGIPQFASGLALDLAFHPPVDLDRALALIQPLVEKFPGQPEYRGVRGRILLRLARLQPAVDDLSWAANHANEPDNEVLQALTEAGNLLHPPAPRPIHKPVYSSTRATNTPAKK